MKKRIFILVLGLLSLFGCHTHEHEQADAGHETEAIVVTQWTDKMEIFMEYEPAVAGHEIKFIIHLTTLTDFQPVRDGKVTLHFQPTSGSSIVLEKDELLREGIFTPNRTFTKTGEYDFRLSYTGPKTNETFDIGKFRVYASAEDIPQTGAESASEQITYLKEQQWKTAFATEVVRRRPVKSAVKAVGEVHPRQASYAEIVSPVDGIVSIAAASKLVKPGQRISKGQTMAVIVPPLVSENSWVKIYLEYEQSKTEFKRAQRLKEKNAISGRDFEQAKRNYELKRAGFNNYFNGADAGLRFDSEKNRFLITAPIGGIVSDVTVLPGQNVERDQKLFSIIDPRRIWLKMELFEDQAANLTDISGASILIPGKSNRINLNSNDIDLISLGEMIDPQKRTITVWLETKNPNRRFLIGQNFSVDIYTSPEREMLTVPLSAVFDDNSQKVVFVHTSGESFEKRILEIGPMYNNYMAVLNGVKEGERVVSTGGYQVKLASTSEEIGHPHAH